MAAQLLKEIQRTEIPDIYALTRILGSQEDEGELFRLADATKQREYGTTVFVRGIIEFSSYCRRSCLYCGISAKVNKAKRYRMEPAEIIETALNAAQYYKTIVLQSAEDPYYTPEMFTDIITNIRRESDVVITMSVGERSPMAYAAMREAGASRFLIKHETADDLLYEKYHDSRLEDRLACQNELRKLGFEIGSGFMVGLPGQTDATLAADLLLLRNQQVDMAGIGPFIAHPDTLLANYPDGSAEKTLRCVALARILLPKCHLPSTTALNEKGGMKNALFCGADVIMQKATPKKYRDLYDLYPRAPGEDRTLKEQRDELDEHLSALGLVSD